MARALALLSGGLDSILAAAMIKEQGIDVVGLVFETPFFSSEAAKKAVEQLDIELKVVDMTDDYLKMLPNPKYGHGANMNPCIDCHAMMLRKAGALLEEMGADFLITGEVLGERPMSQSSRGLSLVESYSGVGDKILRPLSAQLLEPTAMEEEGIVDRSRLGRISGRSRKMQMALAEKYGIQEYPTPAGGCLLTDPGYSKRLRELMQHEGEYQPDNMQLLKIGRHLRMPSGTRTVIGRNKDENKMLREAAGENDLTMHVRDYPGPVTLLRGSNITEEDILLAAGMTVRYSDARKQGKAAVRVQKLGQEINILADITPLEQETIAQYLI